MGDPEAVATGVFLPALDAEGRTSLTSVRALLLVRAPDVIAQALHQLSAHRLRTSLALLGIVVGVAACVASIAVMDGLEGLELGFWNRIGGERVGFVRTPESVYKAGRTTPVPKVYRLSLDDLPFLLGVVPELELISPSLFNFLDIRSKRARLEKTIFLFTGANYLGIRYELRSGRFFSEAEARGSARVAVLFAGVVDDLFGPEDPLGQEILVEGKRVTVIGVLRPVRESRPRLVIMPFQTGQARFGLGSLGWPAWFKLRPGADRNAVGQDIRKALVRRHPGSTPDNFDPRFLGDWQDRGVKDIRAQGRVLISVAMLCLLAGGVGILNVFLISVTERTREIGLRMALGASRRSVLGQLLFEALLLCAAGGATGLALGQAAAWAFAVVIKARGKLDPTHIADLSVAVGAKGALLALGMTLVTAVVFGTYPAWRASRLDPAESLRHE